MFDNVLYYVHHHGNGHVSQAAALCQFIRYPVTILTSADVGDSFSAMDHVNVLHLPLDTDEPYNEYIPDPDLPDCLHFAPVCSHGVRNRMTRIASEVNAKVPNLFIVDVSVEVTLFARLLGIPTIVNRLNGTRNDPGHLNSYGAAVSCLAGWFEEFERSDTPDWIIDKTFFAGGISRFDGRDLESIEKPREIDSSRKTVCVMSGASAEFVNLDQISVAAQETDGWDWLVLGNYDYGSGYAPENVVVSGWVEDTVPYIVHSDVVIGAAGYNTITEVGFVGKPFVCFPEYRPFNEQRVNGFVLEDNGLAKVFAEWSDVENWNDLLTSMVALKDTYEWNRYIDGNGSQRAADHINELVEKFAWKK